MKEYFQIGKIVRPHGVKGVVRAETYTSNPKRFKVLKELSVDGQVYEAESIAIDCDGYMLIKLKGVNTMDDADKKNFKESGDVFSDAEEEKDAVPGGWNE